MHLLVLKVWVGILELHAVLVEDCAATLYLPQLMLRLLKFVEQGLARLVGMFADITAEKRCGIVDLRHCFLVIMILWFDSEF